MEKGNRLSGAEGKGSLLLISKLQLELADLKVQCVLDIGCSRFISSRGPSMDNVHKIFGI